MDMNEDFYFEEPEDEPENPRPPKPTRVVRGRIVLEGHYMPDDEYDSEEGRQFIATTCNGDTFQGDFCVKPSWVEILEDD